MASKVEIFEIQLCWVRKMSRTTWTNFFIKDEVHEVTFRVEAVKEKRKAYRVLNVIPSSSFPALSPVEALGFRDLLKQELLKVTHPYPVLQFGRAGFIGMGDKAGVYLPFQGPRTDNWYRLIGT